MGREVRRVTKDWQHPKNENGRYVALHDEYVVSDMYSEEEIKEGIADGWLDSSKPNYGVETMPNWSAEEATHYQMYENTSEGTPISPVMETPEELAQWLTDNNASAFADMTASYEQWLRVCHGGYAPSFVLTSGSMEIESGVSAMSREADEVEQNEDAN